MKKQNLLPLATVVALCMSATSITVPLGALNFGAQTVYAGVVKRSASSKAAGTTSAATTDASSDANTAKQEPSIGTAASSDGKTYTEVDSNGQVVIQRDLQDGASKYAIPTYRGNLFSSDYHRVSGGYIEDEKIFDPLINNDGSRRRMKEPKMYPEEVYKSSDWLLPNGVAKTPNYLGAELELETASFDDRTTQYPIVPEPDGAAHGSPVWLYHTKAITADHPWPAINPITNRPLWDTQPFWRSDNSFDLYGYLKQFTPEQKNSYAYMYVEGGSNGDKFGRNKTMYGSSITLTHDHQIQFDNDPDAGAVLYLYVALANSACFDSEYHRGIDGGVSFNATCKLSDGTSVTANGQARIKPGYQGQKIRITGTNDAYINEAVLKGLEIIMRYYTEDHTLAKVTEGSDFWKEIPIPGVDQENAKVILFATRYEE
ncbi:hypothetical protein HG470_002520 [Candidatus Saccharibacteria bacterium]|nr:hypothetical protein [Candidatus Saccharibacteria bacterium]